MRYLKDIAMIIAVCMIVTLMPIATFAMPTDNDVQTTVTLAEETTAPDASATPAVTDEPIATATPSAEPEVTATPEGSAAPAVSATPDVTATPVPTSATATPTASATTNPSGKYSITVDSVENSTITTSVKTANKGTKITVNGAAARGYEYSSVYWSADSETKKSSLTNNYDGKDDGHNFESYFTMPASNVVVSSSVNELSATEVSEDATAQITDTKALISKYTSLYLNNSSSYDSSDITKMKNYKTEAVELYTDLTSVNKELIEAINNNDTTKSLMEDVIRTQEELDKVVLNMKDLADSMSGADIDVFTLNLTAGKGGKVTVTGLISGVANGYSSKTTETFDDIETDGSSSLSFTFNTQNGYSLTSFKVNNKSLSVTGNKVTISANTIGTYVSGGEMNAVATFSYSNNGSGGGSGSGTITPGISSPTATPAPVTDPNAVFNDLGSVEWAQESILALYNLGIVNGKDSGEFDPTSAVKREEFAKMMVGIMGYSIDTNAVTEFSDANGDWYTPYIAAAVSNGIISGRGDGTFGVGDNITREDIAVIIYRAMGSVATEIHEFPDSDQISDYAIEAVSYLYSTGIVTGYEDGTFAPKNTASRAEACKMLNGVYNKIHNL